MENIKGKKIIVIGSGFGGLGVACLLSKAGADVTVLEKNDQFGGRAGIFETQGYRFDMGPSWYLMPDVFEQFFSLIGENVHEHLDLRQLSPSYRIFFKDTDKVVDIHSDLRKDAATVDALEPGASKRLEEYLRLASGQYEIAKDRFMYKNYDSIFDFLNWEVITQGRKMSVFSNMQKYVERFFSSTEMQKIVQYPLVFLGSSPYNTPALYNIMSHIDFNMGVYYPQGGVYEIVKALVKIAKDSGAVLKSGIEVEKILVENGKASGVRLQDGTVIDADVVVSNADIHHTEMELLDVQHRTYKERYWEKRTLAPSAFILYLGIDGKIPSITHHNLVFAKDWKKNFSQIFESAAWPDDPSFYVCAPSVTDPSVAPAGKENLFVLVPIAAGLEYDDMFLESYKKKIVEIMEAEMGIPHLQERIEYSRIFSVKDFASRYHSYKGSALGLAHTFMQTAIFRPDTQSKKVKGLYYVGGNTNPGIGMPICLISAQLVYKRLTGNVSSGPLNQL